MADPMKVGACASGRRKSGVMVTGRTPARERVNEGARGLRRAGGDVLVEPKERRYDSAMGPPVIHEAKPVFVIGSPRSGTSVLTWALGQHPNLLLTEESNWLGSFAIQAAAAYAQGSARAQRSQLGALGITRDAFLSGLGDTIDRMILGGRTRLEAASRAVAMDSPRPVSPGFEISRDPSDSKSRWVDGTPEYSLEIPALLALFPRARFVHILRDADQVAASLLGFRDERGRPLVGSAEEAYAYWMRTVQACVDAEAVLGAGVVHRVRHVDLVAAAEPTLRGILDFLAEPFAPACLEPLKRRINSSFRSGAMSRVAPDERSEVITLARRSSAKWLASPPPGSADTRARQHWEDELDVRVLHAQALQCNWEAARRMLSRTRLVLDLCGVVFLGNWLVALALWLRFSDTTAIPWLVLASAMVVGYGWWRRTGLWSIATRALGVAARQIGKFG